MTDTEKKIAEIREALEKIDCGDLFEIAKAYEKSGEWVRFLLDELTEERAAHNAHVTELCELEQERDKLIECLRFYERMARGREANDGGRRARTLLAEIGVTVE